MRKTLNFKIIRKFNTGVDLSVKINRYMLIVLFSLFGIYILAAGLVYYILIRKNHGCKINYSLMGYRRSYKNDVDGIEQDKISTI